MFAVTGEPLAEEPEAVCGNGVVELGEACDGEELGNATCISLDYGSGTLACSSVCTYDISGCVVGEEESQEWVYLVFIVVIVIVVAFIILSKQVL